MSASAPTVAGNGFNPAVQKLVDQYKPYNSAIPGVDVYGSAALGANTAYQNALAKVNQQRQGLLTQYGYTGTIDPTTGSLSNVGVDLHNPYGTLQQTLNKEAYEDQAAGDDAQGRGLRGGLANKATTQLKYAHGGETAALGSQMFSNLNQLQGVQDGAYSDAANSLWQAQLQQLQLAMTYRNFNPADPGDGDGGDGQGSGSGFDPAAATKGVFDPLNNLTLAQMQAASKGVKSPQTTDPGILAKVLASSSPKAKAATVKKTTTKAKAN